MLNNSCLTNQIAYQITPVNENPDNAFPEINENIRINIPSQLLECPLSLQRMINPVSIIACGHSYDEESLKKWYEKSNVCPL